MREIISAYLNNHQSVFDRLSKNTDNIQSAAKLIIGCLKSGGKILLCGNGGSAADAQHIAGEFMGRFKKNRQPLPAIALNADSSVLTCIANDFGFEDVFSRGVDALGNKGDILWAFSTSGSSPNIINAVQSAKAKDMKILAFTGKEGSKLQSISDVCICSSTDSTCIAQEIHQIVYHLICQLVDEASIGG